MDRLYEAIIQGVDFATALAQAQWHLRTLTRQEAIEVLRTLTLPALFDAQSLPLPGADDNECIFADPYYWAPFCFFAMAQGNQ